MADNRTLAVFASEQGPGDAERSSIMSQTGRFLARKGVRIVCPAHSGGLCVPLIKSARSAGGDVVIMADEGFAIPSALSGLNVERFQDVHARRKRIGIVCDAYIGLPGSIGSVTSLYETWIDTGGDKPVALLNRNRAYEVIRGFASDVLSHSVREWERKLQFADSIEELWSRLNRALPAR